MIGVYVGAFIASCHILFPKSSNGAETVLVISDCFKAAITAIHKIANQNICNIKVPKVH